MSTIHVKRGSTLRLPCAVQQNGQAVDITGWQIDCWLRAPGKQVVYRFAPALTNAAAGQYELRASAQDTARWPIGPLSADIRYVNSAGQVLHTATWHLRVADAMTGAHP
ncbi:MAG: hypothetical protein Q4F13_06870 [Pseudomonadota bacterium]|nr:hypothetical protein [Pseudomonadota bacterium]